METNFNDRFKDEGTEDLIGTEAALALKNKELVQRELAKKLGLKTDGILLSKFLGSAGLLGSALGAGYDAYQGRDVASSAFNTLDPNLGQRAAGVGSSIASGLTFGAMGDPEKNARMMYDFYSNMFGDKR